MNLAAIAGRYARALFEVSVQDGDLRPVERQLATFLELLEEQPVLEKALSSPIVPIEKKQAAVSALADKLDFRPEVRKLLAVLVERDALVLLKDILAAFRQRMMDHLGLVQAEVTTAVPLDPQAFEALRVRLQAAVGKEVEITSRVDPSIIGGVVTRMGSIVYDGSVVRHLERIREKIIEGVA